MSRVIKRFTELLRTMFDYQKFDQNPHLAEVIKNSEVSEQAEELGSTDLEQLSAAGSGEIPLSPDYRK
ncbi:MAG: hypothetical protein K6G09_03205 [Treponema sp.]|nr:hypothetical protein [Treponema sp.]